MAEFIAYQDVECIYPMSGQYGIAPRALYYALIIFVIGFRRQDWLTAGAAAACLTYGGSAAVHALTLAPILALGKTSTPNGIVQLPDGKDISIQALATDLDTDAALAIVGTGFLAVIPMAIWSSQFRHSGAVPILVLWILLMFAGMICCMAVLYGVNGSSTGPLRQYRFCSPGYSDTFPFSGNLGSPINNNWNDTVWSYFTSLNATFPSCIYPCLGATDFLRQAGDIRVVEFVHIQPPSPLYWGMNIVAGLIWTCVPLTILFSIAILILRIRGYDSTALHPIPNPRPSWKTKPIKIFMQIINFYGKVLIPVVFIVFLIWAEWIISYDLQSESMQLVGQWAPLVGAALVLVAAVVGRYWPRFAKLWDRFRARRDVVRSCGLKEGVLESMDNVWKERQERSAWSQAGIALLQGSDLD